MSKRKPSIKDVLYEYDQSTFYGLKETMTDEQDAYVRGILGTPVVFSNSKAGTGKTLMAYAALHFLKEHGVIDKIYYVFSPVAEGKMGFRPGTQQEKSLDYSAPIVNAIVKLGEDPHRELSEKEGGTEIVSHTFLRGDTFENIGIIVDEAQNYTCPELKKTLTRISDSCHSVVTGHQGQIDLPNPAASGFVGYLRHFAKLPKDKVKEIPLTHNFRGWIAQHADDFDGRDEPELTVLTAGGVTGE